MAGDVFTGVLTYDSSLLSNVYTLPVINNVFAGYAQTGLGPAFGTDPAASTVTLTDVRSGATVTVSSNYFAEVTARTGPDPDVNADTIAWQNQIQQDGGLTTFDIYIEAPIDQFSSDLFAVHPDNPTDVTMQLDPPALNEQDWAFGSILVYQGDSSFGRAQFVVDQIDLPDDAPEPASLTILATGVAGLGFIKRRKA